MARIFLSHSSKNNFAAIALRDWIVEGGWDEHPFLDLDPKRGIAAGERWERALHEAADRCEVVLFLVSREWLKSEWCLKEFGLAQKLNKRLFGVLIDDLPLADLPITLTAAWQAVNLASGSDHRLFLIYLPDLSKEEHVTFSLSGLARLKAGLDKAGLDSRFFAWPPENDPNRSPYPGLRPLEAEDAGIFFGREASTILVMDRLRGLREAAAPRLLVIQGASGAGKSSFLRAGLIPRLKRDDTHFLPLLIVRPEKAAISGATGLVHAIETFAAAQSQPLNRAKITEAINGGAPELLPLLSQIVEKRRTLELPSEASPAPPSLVLSIDQAEELFLAEGTEESQAFLTLLREIACASAPNLIVLFTIRSDSYERLQAAKALEGVRQETFPLPPMPRGAFQTIIEGPAQRLADSKRPLKLDPALTEQLLTDIEEGGGKDALPLLAFTLQRLYREYGADGDLLLEEYRKLGGIAGSIKAAVDAALTAANADPTIPRDPSERLALLRRAMIPWLASIDPETRTPRRRVARLSEIPSAARGLINCLVEVRLLTTDELTEGARSEIIVEPAHEALLRQWDVLRGWLNEDSAALLTLGRVQQAARDWTAKGQSADWLAHSAGRLEDAERLRDREDLARFITPVEQTYLQACRAQENERSNRELEEARKLVDAQTKLAAAAREQTRIALRNERGLDLHQLGWGVIFAQDTQLTTQLHLWKLLDHRKKGAGARYLELTYRSGESASQLLSRYGADYGPLDAIPYYLLIVGSPEEIPYSVQYELASNRSAGRIFFERTQQYEAYANNVVHAEIDTSSKTATALLFGPKFIGDGATALTVQSLLEPIKKSFEEEKQRWTPFDWRLKTVIREAATKAELANILGNGSPPDLLFIASHGMIFSKGTTMQKDSQGAILCADWPGFGAIASTMYFAASDVSVGFDLRGTIIFAFSPCSAGTPQYDDFSINESARPEIVNHDTMSKLPMELLGTADRGALAFIGHVDRNWGFSLTRPDESETGEGNRNAPLLFAGLLRRLINGYTIGYAMDEFRRRYALEATVVVSALLAQSPSIGQKEYVKQLMAAIDTRNYVIIGDPAVSSPARLADLR